jgi:hypothetical protein
MILNDVCLLSVNFLASLNAFIPISMSRQYVIPWGTALIEKLLVAHLVKITVIFSDRYQKTCYFVHRSSLLASNLSQMKLFIHFRQNQSIYKVKQSRYTPWRRLGGEKI